MLDEFRSTSITWDKATSRIYSPVTANASDENGRKLVVQIVNSGQVEDLTGATLHLYWETRDKAHDGLDVFEAVDLKKGEFELSYTTGMLSNHGVLNANLVLIDTVGRIVSERFKITVTKGIDNDAIQSENSFSSLTQALIDISNLEQNYALRLNDLTAQLQQTKNQFKNKIYLTDNHQLDSFPRLPGETDDTERFQRAIDSFSGNIAGTIHISGDIHISKQVSCYKTGLRLMGDNARKSRIVSNFGGISLYIKPLHNGSPYTSVSYCKFYADDIALVAEGDAIETGTGLWLQWIFASSYKNLYTSGFKKHIVLRGSHLNTFYNLYQGNKDSSELTLELHNRGVGLSADATQDETGENTSNNNHIIGGWINNCSLDFRNMDNTVVEKIDIEPASDTIYTGIRTTFRDCRFERQDYYAVNNNLYPRFPWFEIGSYNKIERCAIHNDGPNNEATLNPYFKIVGNYNEIEVPIDASFNAGMICFEENAKGNVIKYNKNYTSANSLSEYESIRYNSKENKFIFTDFDNGNVVETQADYSNGKGRFESYNSRNIGIVGDDFIKQGLTSEPIDIALPFGRSEPAHFTKLTLTTNTGNRRFMQTATNIKAPETGVYTLNCLIYLPHTASTELTFSPINSIGTRIEKATNKWITVRSRVFLNEGDTIQPTFNYNGQVGEIFYVGEISVCKGNNAIFIPNDGYSPIIKMV